jgi:hypothetical protein
VALVRIDVSEELSTSIVRVTRIGELGTTLAVTRNRRAHNLLACSIAQTGTQADRHTAGSFAYISEPRRCVGVDVSQHYEIPQLVLGLVLPFLFL